MPPKKGPPPKGQRSIASFIFKKDGGDPPGSAAKQQQPDASAVDAAAPLQPSQKRQHPAQQQQPRPLSAQDAASRHQRWQAKLLGEGDGLGGGVVKERVSTQDAVAASTSGSQKRTPLETQVEALQKAHPDCVLAIEVGYKFRFFGRDAEIASNVLGIFSYPDRNYLTASVPVATVDRHVRRLAMAGHKVGVVRQTESAAIKAAGDNRNKPFERRLTAVYTRATLEAGELAAARSSRHVDNADAGGDDVEEHEHGGEEGHGGGSAALETSGREDNVARSSYLVCVVEEEVGKTGGAGPSKRGRPGGSGGATKDAVELGIIAVETSTGEVYYSQVVDGVMRQELESRLMYAVPSELVLVTPLSAPTRRLLEATAGPAVRVTTVDGSKYASGGALAAAVEFYRGRSFGTATDDATTNGSHGGDVDAISALPPLVLRALAHALDHLRPFKLESVLRLGAHFVDFAEVQEMALSPNALSQLEILSNADDGRERGSLLWLMDRTKTAAGARLVRRWVSRPLRDVSAIEARLDAVDELLRCGDENETLAALPRALADIPDVERVLGRVLHGNSSPPEFLTMLNAFKGLPGALGLATDPTALQRAIDTTLDADADLVATPGIQSPLLSRLLAAVADPRCTAVALTTLAAIDAAAAAAGDLPSLFADDQRFADVAERRAALAAAEASLEELRPELARALDLRSVSFVSVQNQGNYLVEVPVEASKRAPSNWERVSATKKVVRFRPPQVKQRLSTLEVERERLALTAKAAWRRLQAEFSEHYATFRAAVRALAALDCLVGFVAVAAEGNYCRPRFVDSSSTAEQTMPAPTPPSSSITTPMLRAVAARHPVLDVMLEGRFVPNDIDLSGDGLRCAIVTGPNMGGKSVYIRAAALLACMAQAGSFVPATSLDLSAFDAIFTRMGAADSLSLGRSTFLEELAEMSTILRDATERSLVIVDELGRGTSTRDGRAIAEAVMQHMVGMGCLTLFVTHYPEVAAAAEHMGAAAGAFRMAHLVADATSTSSSPSIPKVTFLYKIERGVAQSSFGLNVARMAGLPAAVVDRAAAKAAEERLAAEAAATRRRAGHDDDGEAVESTARDSVVALRGAADEEEVKRLQRAVADAVRLACA